MLLRYRYVGYVGTIPATLTSSSSSTPDQRIYYTLPHIQWNPSEVSDVFAVPVIELLNEKRIRIQSLPGRGHRGSTVVVPSWQGPPVREDLVRAYEEEALNRDDDHIHKDGIIVELSFHIIITLNITLYSLISI